MKRALYCNKKIYLTVYTIDGQSFFENAEVRCGWKKPDGSIYQCDKCKKKIIIKTKIK